MAKSTVELLSGQLGNSVINNAISEATLRDLLAAVGTLEKNVDNLADGGGGSGSSDKLSSATNNATAGVKKLIGTVASFAGSGKTFFSMVASGEQRLSKYGNFLNTELIGKLPIVGETFGGLGTVLVKSIEIFESWNDNMRQASLAGANFGNNMTRFKEAANKMLLLPEELVDLISKNSEKFVSMGGTVTKGIIRFSNMTEDLFINNRGIVDELDRMGYGVYEQAELLFDFVDATKRGNYYQADQQYRIGKDFLVYAREMDALQQLTGQDKKTRLEAMAAASQDTTYRLKVQRYGATTQGNIELALAKFSTIYGKQGAELFKSVELNVKPQTDTAIMLMSNLPGLDSAMKEALEMAKKSNNPELFNQYLDEVVAKQLESTKNQIKRLDPILKAGAVGDANAARTVQALNPAIDFIAKRGGTSIDMADAYRKSKKTIEKEQKESDAFTETIRSFERIVREIQVKLSTVFLEFMKDFSREMNLGQVGPKLEALNLQLKTLAEEAMPYIKGFFRSLLSPEGQKLLTDTFFGMMSYLKAEFRYAMSTYVKEQYGTIPHGLARWLGLVGEIEALDRQRQREKENFKQNVDKVGQAGGKAPGASSGPIVTPLEIKVGNKKYVLESLARGQFGEFQYWSGEEVGFGSMAGISLRNKAAIDEILKAREQRAKEGFGVEGNDPAKFGGLTLLQREYLYNNMTKTGVTPLAYSLFDPVRFAGLSKGAKDRLAKRLESPEAQAEMQSMRDKFPNTYMGMRTGTLGTLGKLFGDFGKGTPVTLHGNEAIVTPKQLGDVMVAGNQISVKDVINRLNSNVNRLIQITKEDISIERSKLMALEAQLA